MSNEKTIPELNSNEIVIPEAIQQDLTRGIKRVVEVITRGDNAPNMILTLDRSGTLAYEGVFGYLETHPMQDIPTIGVSLGREDTAPFIVAHPDKILSPDISAQLVGNRYEQNLREFLQYLNGNPAFQNKITALHQYLEQHAPTRILIVDDMRQFGTTQEVLTPIAINLALQRLGLRADVETDIGNAIKQVLGVSTLAEHANDPTVALEFQVLFENQDWIYDIARANFGHILFEFEEETYERSVALSVLTSLLKGTIDIPKGKSKQIDSWEDVNTLIANADKKKRGDIETAYDYDYIPDADTFIDELLKIISENYTIEEIKLFNSGLRKSLRQVGKEI